MAVNILHDENLGYSVMYCSTTMWAFGSIFYEDESIEEFLEWLSPVDPRILEDRELEERITQWRATKRESV